MDKTWAVAVMKPWRQEQGRQTEPRSCYTSTVLRGANVLWTIFHGATDHGAFDSGLSAPTDRMDVAWSDA